MLLVGLLLAMLITLAALPPLSGLAHRVGILAYPDARKAHRGAIPQIGGVAIAASAIVTSAFLLPATPAYFAYLVGALVVFLLGLWDDYREIGYKLKFLVHCVAATIAVAGAGLVVIPLNPPLPDLPGGLALPVAIVFLAGTTNAVNLVDGLDGLAGGLTLLSCLALAVCGYYAENAMVLVLALTLAGGIVGFLRFNTHPARVFMGDNGAFFLGFTVGVVALELFRAQPDTTSLTAVMMMLGIPVLDAILLPFRRVSLGRHAFLSDRSHFHHVLLEAGFSHRAVVVLIYGFHTLLVVTGYMLRHESETTLFAVYATLATAIEASPPALVKLKRWWRAKPIPRANVWFDRLVDLSAGIALAAYVLVSVVPARVTTDFLAGSIAILVPLVAWWCYRRAAGIAWLERGALYVLGAYVVYLGSVGEVATPGVDVFAFGLLGIWLVYRLSTSHDHDFTLTPLDLLVVVTTIGVAYVGGTSLNEVAFAIVKGVAWFYVVELLATRPGSATGLRALAVFGFALIAARGLMDLAL
jgi:UDP-GlcNAc:undecaprenyl-phosphate GlcNAc-1-phosphate transferase